MDLPCVLFLVSTSNYLDRNIISILLEPIKREFQVPDTLLGLLSGFAFALFYAALGIPVARWADRGNRRTVITLAVSVWSVMTVLCGLAQNFWQLALARVGVGAGESGAILPAQSLIADYFAPERRASALAIFVASALAGYLLGILMGGQIAAAYGWRTAFLVAGLPGLALAVLTHFALKEPRTEIGFIARGDGQEALRQTFARLFAKRSFRHALVGLTLYFFIAYGALVFVPSFLMRVLEVPLATVSVAYGAVYGVASAIGTLGGGILADRLVRRDVRWLAWLPAAACALTYPMYMLAFAMHDFTHFLLFGFVSSALLAGGLPPIFAAIHAVCGAHRRAMAIAVIFFSANLLGLGLGPVLTGAASDALSTLYGLNVCVMR